MIRWLSALLLLLAGSAHAQAPAIFATPCFQGGTCNFAGTNITSQVPTNAALKALTAGQYNVVYRAGFNSAGDGGGAVYNWSGSQCSVNSGAGDNGSQVQPSSGAGCWLAAPSPQGLSVQVWGALCNGSTNDAAALQSALNYAYANSTVVNLPAGTCVFNTELSEPSSTKGWGLQGVGPQSSWLVYGGTSTTNDLIAFGTVGSLTPGLVLQNFGVDSNTKMTAGAALHVIGATQSTWHDLTIARNVQVSAANQNVWDGFWTDSGNSNFLNGFAIAAQQDGILASGANTTGEENIGPSFTAGLVLHTKNGIHLGGGVGGFYLETSDILENYNDVVIDNAVAGVANDQAFFGPGAILDAATNDNVLINTATSSGGQYIFNGWIASATNGIEIESCSGTGGCQITLGSSGEIANETYGILIDSTAGAVPLIYSSAHIWQYYSAGIQCNATPAIFQLTTMPSAAKSSASAPPINGACGNYTGLSAHVISYGPGPTVSACGASPTLYPGSTDNRGIITIGTGTVTSCTVTFAQSFSAGPGTGGSGGPVCSANMGGTNPVAVSFGTVNSNSVQFVFPSSPGNQIYYNCAD